MIFTSCAIIFYAIALVIGVFSWYNADIASARGGQALGRAKSLTRCFFAAAHVTQLAE